MKRTAFIAFVFVTTIYILLGSIVFHFIEGANEEEEEKIFQLDYEKFLESHTCLPPEELHNYIQLVLEAYVRGVPVMATIANEINKINQSSSSNGTVSVHHSSKWDIVSSFLFCLTVVSTIGYGVTAPVTEGGQIFCVMFALIGVPLFATCLVGVGERLQIPLRSIKKRDPWYKSDPKIDEKIKTGVFLTTGISLLLFVPSIILSKTEDWSFIESLYFSIITMTTIGFGDYVPGKGSNNVTYYLHRIFLCVWILLGLSWVALILSELATIMKEHIAEAARKTSDRIENLEDKVKKKAKDARERLAQKDDHSDAPSFGDAVDDVPCYGVVNTNMNNKNTTSRLSPRILHTGEGDGTPGLYRTLGSVESSATNDTSLKPPSAEESLSRVDVR